MQAEHNFHDQKTLSQEINSRRKKLDQHPVFSHIRDIHDLRIFMESHHLYHDQTDLWNAHINY